MNTNKAKGNKAEREFVAWLRDAGFVHADRTLAGQREDRGDVSGLPGAVFQVKSHNRMELARWVDEANEQRANAHAEVAVVVAKRRGKTDPAEWYYVLDGASLVELLRAWSA